MRSYSQIRLYHLRNTNIVNLLGNLHGNHCFGSKNIKIVSGDIKKKLLPEWLDPPSYNAVAYSKEKSYYFWEDENFRVLLQGGSLLAKLNPKAGSTDKIKQYRQFCCSFILNKYCVLSVVLIWIPLWNWDSVLYSSCQKRDLLICARHQLLSQPLFL